MALCDPNLTMSLFLDAIECAHDPATKKLIEPYLDLDRLAKIPHALASALEMLAMIHRRHLSVSTVLLLVIAYRPQIIMRRPLAQHVSHSFAPRPQRTLNHSQTWICFNNSFGCVLAYTRSRRVPTK